MQFLPSHQTYSQRHQNQLILELLGTDEEGLRFSKHFFLNLKFFIRYYSIPEIISAEPAVVKLLQSGKKLHIFNEHILVASKSRG
jgi:hypothetical protein